MSSLKPLALPLTFAAAAALSACSFEAGPTVSGEELAEAAADALEGELGSRPDMDCGDEDIIVSVDKEVDCTATDPATGTEYDATVTFTGVDGDEWNIAVEMGEAPAGAPAEESSEAAEETTGAAPDDQASSEPIPATAIADAAEDALEGEIGTRPDIDCGDEGLTIVPREGRITYCTLTDPADGAEYEVTVTFVDVSGGTWNVSVSVASEPK